MDQIFQRMETLIKANIRELIRQSGNPDGVLSNLLSEITHAKTDLSKEYDVLKAEEDKLIQRLDALETEISTCEKEAEQAIKQDDEDQAKKWLFKQTDLESEKKQYNDQKDAQSDVAASLQKTLELLQQKAKEVETIKSGYSQSAHSSTSTDTIGKMPYGKDPLEDDSQDDELAQKFASFKKPYEDKQK